MVARTDPARSIVELAGVALPVCNQLGQRTHGHLGSHDEDRLGLGQHGDRREVLEQVIGQVTPDAGILCQCAAGPEPQRVTVRRCIHDGLRGQELRGAGLVLDDDWLGQDFVELGCIEARKGVGASARTIAHQDLDRTGRELLCQRACCSQRGRAHQDATANDALHAAVPSSATRRIGTPAP
ncbi:hypothetical protein D3C86_1522550 [compost metagenome]